VVIAIPQLWVFFEHAKNWEIHFLIGKKVVHLFALGMGPFNGPKKWRKLRALSFYAPYVINSGMNTITEVVLASIWGIKCICIETS
jgi:hypothetical protein